MGAFIVGLIMGAIVLGTAVGLVTDKHTYTNGNKTTVITVDESTFYKGGRK